MCNGELSPPSADSLLEPVTPIQEEEEVAAAITMMKNEDRQVQIISIRVLENTEGAGIRRLTNLFNEIVVEEK